MGPELALLSRLVNRTVTSCGRVSTGSEGEEQSWQWPHTTNQLERTHSSGCLPKFSLCKQPTFWQVKGRVGSSELFSSCNMGRALDRFRTISYLMKENQTPTKQEKKKAIVKRPGALQQRHQCSVMTRRGGGVEKDAGQAQ
jgi:hypothetical protein